MQSEGQRRLVQPRAISCNWRFDSPANRGTPARTSMRNLIANFTLWARVGPPRGMGFWMG